MRPDYGYGLPAVLCTLALAGCTKSPQSIAPEPVSSAIYADKTCEWLDIEAKQIEDKFAATSQQQQRAYDNEKEGFILSGWPLSTLSGDNIAPQVARIKGEQLAVQKARAEKGC